MTVTAIKIDSSLKAAKISYHGHGLLRLESFINQISRMEGKKCRILTESWTKKKKKTWIGRREKNTASETSMPVEK
jgi:hypothetical protein